MVCLAYLPIFSMNTADLLSNIMRGACSGTTCGYLFRNSLFITLKCARYIFQFIMHCIHLQHYIDKMDLENVCNDQLVHIDKKR